MARGKSARREAAFKKKKAAKAARMKRAGSKSRYAKKVSYIKKHGGWGGAYPEPKPWKTSAG